MEKELKPTKPKSQGLTPSHVTEKKIKTMSVSEYARTYHPGLTNQAIDYAMNTGRIDFVKLGRFRYVCLTKKTADYVPRNDPKRGGRTMEASTI